MIMRNISLLILALLVITSPMASARQPKAAPEFVLKGTIKGFTDPYIYLYHTKNGNPMNLDSCAVKNGQFEFRGSVPEPQQIFLHSKNRKLQKVIYAENVVMTVSGDINGTVKVAGSATQSDYERLEDKITAHRAEVIKLYNAAEVAKVEGDTAKMKKLNAESDALYRKEKDVRKQFILENPRSAVVLQELMIWMDESNYKEARVIYNGLDPAVKALSKAKEITTRLDNLEKVDLGKAFVDFTQKDAAGNPVTLSSYKGKYVLLEFWASWCGPCRAENPNLRAAYLKYKDKGLNILGVSLDENEARWKKAMEQDKLPWTQVSDLKGWKNEVATKYGIMAIPANFLIDPQGKIVKRNLRGEELNKALEEIFN